MSAVFDHERLVEALERAREQRGLSWRQVASEAQLDPSTLVRIVGGRIPDLPRFAALIDWLGVPADTFIDRTADQPHAGVFDIVITNPNGPSIYVEIKAHSPLPVSALQGVKAVAQAAVDMYETAG